MLKVTVTSPSVRRMQGIGKVSAKPYDMSFQTVWLHTHDKDGAPLPFPEKIEIILDKDPSNGQSTPYAPGAYQLHPSSIYVDAKGGVAVAPRLVPLKTA